MSQVLFLHGNVATSTGKPTEMPKISLWIWASFTILVFTVQTCAAHPLLTRVTSSAGLDWPLCHGTASLPFDELGPLRQTQAPHSKKNVLRALNCPPPWKMVLSVVCISRYSETCVLTVTTKKGQLFASLAKSCRCPWLLLMTQPLKHRQSDSAVQTWAEVPSLHSGTQA